MADARRMEEKILALEKRVQELEDVQAIRRLHHAYGYYIDICRYADVVQLFARDGEVVFLSGVYRGHAGISRLYETWFHQLFTEGRAGAAEHGFLLEHLQLQDIITVAPDGATARARFRALLLGGSHDARKYRPAGLPDQFWEGGVYENEYVREDGVWKIRRLDYVVQWQAEYDRGWAHTESHLKPLTRTFPDDPVGPDALLPEDQARRTWPDRTEVTMHYAHPVLQVFGPVPSSREPAST